MSNEYDDRPIGVSKPSGGGGKNKPKDDDSGKKFANAVKNSGIGKLGQAVADAPLAMHGVADKVGKKVGKFGKALGF